MHAFELAESAELIKRKIMASNWSKLTNCETYRHSKNQGKKTVRTSKEKHIHTSSNVGSKNHFFGLLCTTIKSLQPHPLLSDKCTGVGLPASLASPRHLSHFPPRMKSDRLRDLCQVFDGYPSLTDLTFFKASTLGFLPQLVSTRLFCVPRANAPWFPLLHLFFSFWGSTIFTVFRPICPLIHFILHVFFPLFSLLSLFFLFIILLLDYHICSLCF